MIDRKYDTQLVHVENVQKTGVKGWCFNETKFKPTHDYANARIYLRIAPYNKWRRVILAWGGYVNFRTYYLENNCDPITHGGGGWGHQILNFGAGETIEIEKEIGLVEGFHCYLMVTGGTDCYGPSIDINIESYVLETGQRAVFSGSCSLFRWIGDRFATVSQIFRDIGDRMGTIWFVGDIIQTWFNIVADYIGGVRDWFYGVAEWCEGVVECLISGDLLTWLLGFFTDPGGYITGFLGDAWTWLQSLYSDFSGAVTDVLGGAWMWLQGLYSNFSGAVTDVLGGTWTWVQGLYSDFSGAVFDVLGSVWNDLRDMYSDFGSWVTGALGGTWDWLTEFVNDPMSKLSLDLLELVKSGFEWLTQEWFSFIDTSWDTFKGSFEWLLQKFFVVLDESWDNFEDTLKWLAGKSMDLVGDAAEELKYQIWEMMEKVVKKL